MGSRVYLTPGVARLDFFKRVSSRATTTGADAGKCFRIVCRKGVNKAWASKRSLEYSR